MRKKTEKSHPLLREWVMADGKCVARASLKERHTRITPLTLTHTHNSHVMNTGNACGFFLLGLAMWMLPVWAPEYFPANGLDGSSTRALWLQTVGVVQALIGVWFIASLGLVPAIARWLANAPALQPRWKNAPVPANAAPVAAFTAGEELAAGVALLKQGSLVSTAGGFEADRVVPFRREDSALGRSLEVALLDEKRFVHFLKRLRLLAHRDGNRAHAHGAAPIVLGHDAQHALVHFIKSGRVDFEQLKRGGRNGLRNLTSGAFLRKIANEIDEVVGDTRRAA